MEKKENPKNRNKITIFASPPSASASLRRMNKEETLKKAILSAQEASKDIADFKEGIKTIEEETKGRRQNLLNVLASALSANNQRPLRTKDNAYVYVKKTKGDLTVIPDRLAVVCDTITDSKLLEISKEITDKTGRPPTLLETVFAAIQQQLEEVCCPQSETVAVSRRRPAKFGNVEANEASAQVEKHVEQYLELNERMSIVRGQKKKGMDAFKAKEMQTSDVLTQLVGSAMADGNVPSAKMRFVAAPATQKNVRVISPSDVLTNQQQAAVVGLPKVPASLEAYLAKEDSTKEQHEEEEDAEEDKDDESIISVPGLPNTLEVVLKMPELAAKASNKAVAPKSSEFLSNLTKDSVYQCIQPALIAAGTKKDSINALVNKTVTQDLLHQIWTETSRQQFTMAMLALREKISLHVKGVREAEKVKKAAAGKQPNKLTVESTKKRPKIIITAKTS